MARSRTVFHVLAALFWLGAPAAPAQQPARKEESCPLSRPQALVVWASSDPRQTLQSLVSLVQTRGFSAQNVNWNEGSVEASRTIDNQRQQEKLLIWVERDFERPQEALKVFLVYGLYETVFGTGLRRVRLDASEEQGRVGAVREAIIQASLAGGVKP